MADPLLLVLASFATIIAIMLGKLFLARFRRSAQLMERRKTILAGEWDSVDASGCTVPTGVAVEWGVKRNTVTLVRFDDGTVDLFNTHRASVGFAYHDEQISDAAERLCAELESLAPKFTPSSDFPLPRNNDIVFYLIRDTGSLWTGTFCVQDVRNPEHSFCTAEKLARELLTSVEDRVPDFLLGVVPKAPMEGDAA